MACDQHEAHESHAGFGRRRGNAGAVTGAATLTRHRHGQRGPWALDLDRYPLFITYRPRDFLKFLASLFGFLACKLGQKYYLTESLRVSRDTAC